MEPAKRLSGWRKQKVLREGKNTFCVWNRELSKREKAGRCVNRTEITRSETELLNVWKVERGK